MKCINSMEGETLTSDGRVRQYRWPCGRCKACRITRRQEWTLRILLEMRVTPFVYFCTLTYHDRDLPPDHSVHKWELQDFLKRLRKRRPVNSIRYFAVGEYGEDKLRPHYHLVIFSKSEIECFDYDGYEGDKPVVTAREVIESWYRYSRTECVPVLEDGQAGRVARYVAGYVVKKWTKAEDMEYHGIPLEPEFSLMSRKPGIGLSGPNLWGIALGPRSEDRRPIQMLRYQGKLYPVHRTLKDKLKERMPKRDSGPIRTVFSNREDFLNGEKEAEKIIREHDEREAFAQLEHSRYKTARKRSGKEIDKPTKVPRGTNSTQVIEKLRKLDKAKCESIAEREKENDRYLAAIAKDFVKRRSKE